MIEEHVALNKLEFRIKTEEEFIEEFGDSWRVFIPSGWVSPEMNHLFNYKFSKKDNLELFRVFIGATDNFLIKDNTGDTWHVDKIMIVLNKK